MIQMVKYCKFLVLLVLLISGLSLEAAQILGAGIEEGCQMTLQLEPDEVAIFAYGSLMLVDELERQRPIDDPYTGPFIMVRLKGFKRTWSAHYPNKEYVKDKSECFKPKTRAYLNVEPSEDSKVNGVLFVCSKRDLELYDSREAPYDRIRINDYLEGVTVVGGSAYVYTAKPEWYMPTEELSVRQTIILGRYIDKIEKALEVAGEEFAIEFKENTQDVPPELVVE